MLATDEDSVTCDFAETYHIYNLRALPLRYAATLAFGLRDNSRIKLKMAGVSVPTETLLNAVIADRLGLLVWFQTEAGQKNRDRPKSLVALLDNANKDTSNVVGYDSGNDFETAWNRINGN